MAVSLAAFNQEKVASRNASSFSRFVSSLFVCTTSGPQTQRWCDGLAACWLERRKKRGRTRWRGTHLPFQAINLVRFVLPLLFHWLFLLFLYSNTPWEWFEFDVKASRFSSHPLSFIMGYIQVSKLQLCLIDISLE